VTALRLTADRATGSNRPHTSSLRSFEHNKTACLNNVGFNVSYTLGKTKIFWDDLLVDFGPMPTPTTLCFGSDRAASPMSAGVPCDEKYLIALRFAAINLSGIEIRDSFDIVPLPLRV
jgi:hypothetical protein